MGNEGFSCEPVEPDFLKSARDGIEKYREIGRAKSDVQTSIKILATQLENATGRVVTASLRTVTRKKEPPHVRYVSELPLVMGMKPVFEKEPDYKVDALYIVAEGESKTDCWIADIEYDDDGYGVIVKCDSGRTPCGSLESLAYGISDALSTPRVGEFLDKHAPNLLPKES